MKYTRRKILGAGASGLIALASGGLLSASEPSLEQLAREWNMPLSRVQEIARECRQPVEETLRGSGVIYVTKHRGRDLDWRNSVDLRIIQANRQREIYQEHLPSSERKPVLEFFYDNKNGLGDNASTQHLASVFSAVSFYSAEIKTLAFKRSEEGHYRDQGDKFKVAFRLKMMPTIAIYEVTPNGNISRHRNSFEPGFRGMKAWNNWYKGIRQYLQDNM